MGDAAIVDLGELAADQMQVECEDCTNMCQSGTRSKCRVCGQLVCKRCWLRFHEMSTTPFAGQGGRCGR